ncbi:MAG: hypothetical protein NTY76_00310 [Candidatus Omnitrophica bacterium]|nr:hypothetical protein [Candidatus Omnitrophota bacterium]
MITIDSNIITAWATLIGVLVAIWAVIYQNKRSTFALGVDLIMKLDDRFNSEKMRKARCAAATSLLNGNISDATEVLDFFETIGYFIRRGALDKKTVWQIFFYWANNYWHSAKEYIEQERRGDPTVWANIPYLHSVLMLIEKRERRCGDSAILLTKEKINNFLNEETRLS